MRVVFAIIAGFMLVIGTAAVSAAGEASTGDILVDALHNKGILDDAQYNELKKAKAEGGEQAAQRKLIDTLHEKGVLDDAQYKKLSEQVDQEARAQAAAAAAPQATPAPQAAAVSPERPFDKTLTNMEEGFARLGGDNVKLKIGVLLQTGWLNDDVTPRFSVAIPPATNRVLNVDNQFFVRRARLFFDATMFEKTGFRISIETSDPAGKILRDAYFFADYIPYARVTLGQFKDPFDVESVESIGDNPAINRSLVANFIADPTLRDIGVMLSGKYVTKAAGLPFGAGYAVALTNGTGKNVTDDNDAKDVVGRAWINPFIPGLTTGGSWYIGESHVTPAGFAATDKDHDRWAADIDYLPPYLAGLKLRGEAMWERKFYTTYASTDITNTSSLPTFKSAAGGFAHSFGWYARAAYTVKGLQGFWRYLNGFEPVVRYDYLDEDTDTQTHVYKVGAVTHTDISRNNSRRRLTLGMNYYFNKYSRLMLNWEAIHADNGLRTSSLETIDTVSHHLFTTLLQIKF